MNTQLFKIVSAMLVVLHIACSYPAYAATKTVTIWCWDPNFNIGIMKKAAERYSKSHPDVAFEIPTIGREDIYQKLLTNLSSGFTQSLPDIVLIEDTAAQKYLRSFPGAFADLSTSVDSSKFVGYKLPPLQVDEQTFGLPFDSGVTGLFYRRDYLQDAGFQPEDLENISWPRFIEIGKTVEAKTGKKMLPLIVDQAGMLRVMLQSVGGWYFDKNGNVSLQGNSAFVRAVEQYKVLLASDIYLPLSGDADFVGAFTSGNVASVITGVWSVGSIKSATDQAGKWGVAPIPSLSGIGATNISNQGGSSWFVLESGKEKAEAIEFLNETYGADVEFYQEILKQYGAVGSLKEAQGGDGYNESDPFFGGQKIWLRFADWLTKIPPVNYGLNSLEVEAAFISRVPDIRNGVPLDDVIKRMEAEAKARIQ